MLFDRKIVARLLAVVGLLMACFASPAMAAGRGNAADFDGTWNTVIPEFGARYKLILRVDGETVTGDFLGEDPQYSGTITGTVDPSLDGTASGGRLNYTYVQPQVGGSGGGYFIVGKDGTIQGFTYSDDNTVKKYGWEGKRTSKKVVTPPSGGDIREVGANGTTVYDDAGNETGTYLDPGEKVTVVECSNESGNCKISKPVAGFVDGNDLK